ncbi:DUF2147 domain-containing protein [Phyllobacterium sp. YR531]|uniref:DUF2147 domain-containing protein n=1 Tax=Phyllobacterium sp. YR531 TaxID=1144343 RepID=UPI00026F6C34|nr:DUF2147 domain-containing protein [Phyllobacterium sp. YR531]EJN06248.1 hypothetical protein PMI41_00311 [Phyllobacterium sp. YR531]
MANYLKLGVPLFLAATLSTAAIAQVQEVVGTYINKSGGTKVELAHCGAGLCGTVIWMKTPVNDVNNPDASKRDRPVVGIQAVSLKSTGESTYAGSLYDTESGKTYSGKAKFSDKDVELSGCILGGLLCKTSVWQRVD